MLINCKFSSLYEFGAHEGMWIARKGTLTFSPEEWLGPNST